MNVQQEIKDLETLLTPTDAKGVMVGMVNMLKIGTNNIDDKVLLGNLFQLGILHYMLLIEGAMKDVTKNKSTDGSTDDAGAKDPVVGDTDQPDQVRE